MMFFVLRNSGERFVNCLGFNLIYFDTAFFTDLRRVRRRTGFLSRGLG